MVVRLAHFAMVASLIAVAMFLFMINHSLTCDGAEGAAEATLKRHALEMRLLVLEQQALENTVLVEKFIRRLDEKFSITAALPLGEARSASHHEAMAVSNRLAEEEPPPMPDFSTLFADADALGDNINRAFDRLDDDVYSLDGGGGGGEEGGEEGGWDGLDGQDALETEFGALYAAEEAAAAAPPETAEERAAREKEADLKCKEWRDKHGVVPGVSWGSLPLALQDRWKALLCDAQFEGAAPAKEAAGEWVDDAWKRAR